MGGSAYGKFSTRWASPTENGTVNNFYMSNETYLNKDILTCNKYVNYDKQNVNIIYTDETWVNAHHTNEVIWVDEHGRGGWKVPSGKGQRLIIFTCW